MLCGNSESKLLNPQEKKKSRSESGYVAFLVELRSGNYGRRMTCSGSVPDYGQIVFVDPEAKRYNPDLPDRAPEWYNAPYEGSGR